MTSAEQMDIHISERSALLERATRLLKEDSRIAAAWLHGSMGRGTHDEWSDIDLWIVVADDQTEALRGERQEFASRMGPQLLTIEAPQNAPPGGAYLLAMYPGTNGPHILDFSWQPLSSAHRPADTVLLFERASIPPAEPANTELDDMMPRRAVAQTRFFWMMSAIVAKYIARNDTWEVIGLLSFLASVLREVEWLAGKRTAPAGYHDHPDFAPPTDSSAQFASLRTLIEEMKSLMREAPALSGSIAQDIDAQIDLFLSFIERSKAELRS